MMIPFTESPLDAYRGSGRGAKPRVDLPVPVPLTLEQYLDKVKKWEIKKSLNDYKLVKVANSTD